MYTCLGTVNVTESQAAWLGFSMTMSGCLGSVVVGAILDRFLGYLKLVVEVLTIVGMVRRAGRARACVCVCVCVWFLCVRVGWLVVYLSD